MSTPSPIEEVNSAISSIQSRIGSMQDSVRLKNTLNAIEDLQTNLSSMPQQIAKLRTNGYVFEKSLEAQAAEFPKQWNALHPPLINQVNRQSTDLQAALRPIEQKMSQLLAVRNNPASAKMVISTLKNELDMLENKVRSAESTLNGMYDKFRNQVDSLSAHLKKLEYMISQLAEAKFTLLPSEGGLRAVKAVWCKDVKERDDDPEGVLYLTDQRLIFEQKEEVATKKFLFITTAKEKVQELEWEIPVALVDQMTTSKLGLLKNEDHLDIRFKQGATHESVHLHIWEDCNEWMQLINRARLKDFDKDRAVAIDKAEIDKVKAVPSQCPSCGANLDQVILRGQDSVKCQYCGFVIRL